MLGNQFKGKRYFYTSRALALVPIIVKALCASFCLYGNYAKNVGCKIMSMTKIISLCRNSEFQRLYRRGKSAVRPTLVMYAIKGRQGQIRLGITAGKKLGGAVERNRAKRRLRELFRLMQPDIKPNIDICIVARGRVLNAPYDKLFRDFKSALEELSLFKDEKTTD